MKLPPFLLANWLAITDRADSPVRYNLAGSAGPRWRFGDLFSMGGAGFRADIENMNVSYAPSRGTTALREQIAKLHGVDPDWVMVTTGASEALSILLCTSGEPGSSVLLPAPGYPATEVMAASFGWRLRTYALDAGQQFKQDAATVLAEVDASTRLVGVNTPHNPTGSVMRGPELSKLAAALGERGIPLLVDEVFHRLYHGEEQRSAAGIPNTIVVGDMSKSLSLSGLRIGWLIDADAERRNNLLEARSYFSISSSPLVEALAAKALESSSTLLARLDTTARTNLAALEQFIAKYSAILRWARPAGGTLAFPWLASGADARPLCSAWAQRGVLVAPGDCFGVPQNMRICFAAADARDFVAALNLMGEVLDTWPAAGE